MTTCFQSISSICLCLFASASAISAGDDSVKQRDLVVSAQGNFYHGSIVGRDRVDGISGATKNSPGGTLGVEYNLKGHHLQAMVTFGSTNQSITYDLPSDGISGTRDIKLFLLDIPLMYNFHLLRMERFGREFPRLILSVGAFGSFVLHQEITDTTLESSDVSSWALGPFFRAAYYPWPFKWLQPGVFLDFYRSFIPKVYDDRFFDESSSGQLGILNMGLSLRF